MRVSYWSKKRRRSRGCLENSSRAFLCARSPNTDAHDEDCKRVNKSTGSKPMIQIPAMLLFLPVFGQRYWRPRANAVVDGHRSHERKADSENLDSKSDCNKSPGRFTHVLEG